MGSKRFYTERREEENLIGTVLYILGSLPM